MGLFVAGGAKGVDVGLVVQGFFGCGGGDYGKQGQTNFGGGGGAGVKIDPVAFLVIKDGTTRVMPVAVPPVSTVDRIVDMAPDIVDKIGKFFDKKDGDETV